jgi:hypothetical protein
MTKAEFEKLKRQQIGRYDNLANAIGAQDKREKASAVMLGDDEQFWVVTLATMEKLIKLGYEVAN